MKLVLIFLLNGRTGRGRSARFWREKEKRGEEKATSRHYANAPSAHPTTNTQAMAMSALR